MYFVSGVVGGLLQILFAALMPGNEADASVVGASAGAFGLVAGFTVLYPNQRLLLLLFFVIPLAMRARTLLWLSIALAALGMVYPYLKPFAHAHLPAKLQPDLLFDNIGHAAHLGGIVTGLIITRWMKRGRQRRYFVESEAKSSLKIVPAPE